jgi:hypothetical protein
MCDSFLGEGGGRGLANRARLLNGETPPCLCAQLQPHPSPRRDLENVLNIAMGFKPIAMRRKGIINEKTNRPIRSDTPLNRHAPKRRAEG